MQGEGQLICYATFETVQQQLFCRQAQLLLPVDHLLKGYAAGQVLAALASPVVFLLVTKHPLQMSLWNAVTTSHCLLAPVTAH